MNQRQAILNGVKCATASHIRLGVRNAIENSQRSNVDVFGSILNRNAVLLFRPLENLLGACLEGGGIIVSTKRPLPVQRFTGSHELGHLELGHDIHISLDGEEILSYQPSGSLVELEANAFAGEFLLPRWLLALHVRRQGWGGRHLEDPLVVYQLSLRVGASYEATIRAMVRHSIISESSGAALRDVVPKEIKQKLLDGHEPENFHRDVWLITPKDEGQMLEGQRDDIFFFRVSEKSGAGYLWDFEDLKKNGFTVIKDENRVGDDDLVGSSISREVHAEQPQRLRGKLDFVQCRPWQPEDSQIEHLGIHYDLYGKEVGLPRSQRPIIGAYD
jgi:Zn-dependent peptidase ImmA (M78 family)